MVSLPHVIERKKLFRRVRDPEIPSFSQKVFLQRRTDFSTFFSFFDVFFSFFVQIEMGSTHVRIGSSIFGARGKPAMDVAK